MLQRQFTAKLVSPEDLRPSREDLEIIGVFNPGAVATDDGIALIVRVAERPRERREGYIALPYWIPGKGIEVEWVPEEETFHEDPRKVTFNASGLFRLTFVSHLRVLFSRDGRSIDAEGPMLVPENIYEEFGLEDPRITKIGDTFYFTYVAVSRQGVATSLASTRDFRSFERHGIIFYPENKDVVLFPERFGADYLCFHRPNPVTPFTAPKMWIGRSSDLIHWGRHESFLGGMSAWEWGRVGAGPPPVRTPDGWLEIYHGAERPAAPGAVGVYSAAAILLDLEDPRRIIRRSRGTVMAPEADFERGGFVGHVVFPTGIVERDDLYLIYYGAADTHTAVAAFRRDELLASLVPL